MCFRWKCAFLYGEHRHQHRPHVARGKTQPHIRGYESILHGVPIGEGNARVVFDVVLHNVPLYYQTEHFITTLDVIDIYIKWPETLLSCVNKMDPSLNRKSAQSGISRRHRKRVKLHLPLPLKIMCQMVKKKQKGKQIHTLHFHIHWWVTR